MNTLLNEILNTCRPYAAQGKVATYIPELEKANPCELGIYIVSSNGEAHFSGDYQNLPRTSPWL